MKVAVMMFYDDNIKYYGDINYNINKLYCEKYNLEIILSNKPRYNNRHPAWERLPLLLENITNFDYLIWIDSDAFFYNDANNIIDIINSNKNVNFIFSNDIGDNNINSGIFIVKNSQYSIDFLTKWAYDEELYKNNPYPYWWDQGVLVDMWNKNILDIQNNSSVIKYGILQHFFLDDKRDNETYVFHLAGKKNIIRYIVSRNYFNKINNIIMDCIESEYEYENKNDEKQMYLDDLKNIIIKSNILFEGSCFYHNHTLSILPELHSKQLNLFWCGKQAVENICEIGFNAGHSTMVMLLGRTNTPLNFTIFDIGRHSYTKPSFEYIKSKFSHVNFEYIEGDSTIMMPEWINNNSELMYKYDVVHINGGRTQHCVSNDMKNSDLLVKTNGLVIVDDTNCEQINECVNLYISTGNYVEIYLLPTYCHPHRVIKKIK
jgi:hypothetical protein